MDDKVTKRRSDYWLALVVFLFLSFLAMFVLSSQPTDFSRWRYWIIAGGAVFFPIFALITLLAIVFDWSNAKTDRTLKWMFGLIILVPLSLIAAVVGGYFLLSAFGWFATIPSWAAVIIVLLLLIYLKK
jgi:uncharacterized membrane protein YdjX (TVP38/TMEM64 family)